MGKTMKKQKSALILGALCIFAIGVATADTETAPSTKAQAQKAVLVTGASTGIGRRNAKSKYAECAQDQR